MQTATVRMEGMDLSKSSPDADNKAIEIINMRFRNNAWQPIGKKITKNLYPNLPDGSGGRWERVWLHKQDDIENYIGIIEGALYMLSFGSAPVLIEQYEEVTQVVFVKRFMIVIHSEGMDRYIWKDDSYLFVQQPKIVGVNIKSWEKSFRHETIEATTAEGILGQYKAKCLEINRDTGELTGSMMVRVALRMFDGSYVLHSIPQYVKISDLTMTFTETQAAEQGQENDPRTILFYTGKAYVEFDLSFFANKPDEEIYTHLVVFATKNEILYPFDEDNFTQDFLINEVAETGSYFEKDFDNIFDSVNSAFREMAKSESWYNVYEIPISEINNIVSPENTGDLGFPLFVYKSAWLDTKDFLKDYATRETLPVDQFSHHTLIAGYGMNYNSRLVLANIDTKFADYWMPNPLYIKPLLSPDPRSHKFNLTSGYIKDSGTKEIYALFTLNTTQGEIKKLIPYGEIETAKKIGSPSTEVWFQLPPILGYPDARATKLEFIMKHFGGYYKVASFSLKKNMNYAYYHSDKFSVSPSPAPDSNENYLQQIYNSAMNEQVNINLYLDDKSLSDTNRVQISEVNNPLFFHAKNSYQVGTGQIRGIAANTEPLSEGQFGQHPLQVFTSTGVWAMIQGQGDILITHVVPSSAQVVKENTEIIPTGDAVIFIDSNNWLFALSGRDSLRLSEPLDTEQVFDIKQDLNFNHFIRRTDVGLFDTKVQQIGFLEYIQSSVMGYDRNNRELIITNKEYDYSYIYSFESNFWFKIGRSFEVLIGNYPFLEALDESVHLSISQEQTEGHSVVMYLSREQSLGMDRVFKKLDRSLLRCSVKTSQSTKFLFAIWGSDDNANWQLTSGNDRKSGYVLDVRTGRSHKKWKFYIVMVAGEVAMSARINEIVATFQPKLSAKLR